MNVAALVVCFNDGYKINEWENNYNFYKESLYRLIIIDNGSEECFLNDVKSRFSDATIIENKKNLGSTGAYNAGIIEALKDEMVDAIMLIGNDIKISSADVIKLKNALSISDEVGMVAPVLLNKDSQVIADAGSDLSYFFVLEPRHKGEIYDKQKISNNYAVALTGGMNMATRKFYEVVGLQDQRMFMYSDEADMAIRAHKAGFKMLVIGDAVAWHQHINPSKRENRLPYSSYLIARNKVYLGKKHYGNIRAFFVFIYFICLKTVFLFRNKLRHVDTINEKYAMRGAWNGLVGNMEMPQELQLS